MANCYSKPSTSRSARLKESHLPCFTNVHVVAIKAQRHVPQHHNLCIQAAQIVHIIVYYAHTKQWLYPYWYLSGSQFSFYELQTENLGTFA
jgi:hypothetical protein